MYPQKKNLPCQHVTEASTNITVHYRNGIHAKPLHGQRPTSDTLHLNGVYPCLASRHAECTHIKHVSTTQLMTRREDGIRGMDHSIIPRNSRDAAQHTYKTRGSSSLVVQEIKSDIK
jgi:hypothetical protein